MATGVQPSHIENVGQHLHSPLAIYAYKNRSLKTEVLEAFLAPAESDARRLGVAAEYESTTSQTLSAIAFSTRSQVLVVEFETDDSVASDGSSDIDDQEEGNKDNWREILERVLLRPDWTLLGFNMDRLALGLHHSLQMRLNNGIDIQSTLPRNWMYPRTAPETYAQTVGGIDQVKLWKLKKVFEDEAGRDDFLQKLAFRAWTAFITQFFNDLDNRIPKLPKVDTTEMEENLLDTLNKIFHDAALLENLKPTYFKTEIQGEMEIQSNSIDLPFKSYQDRIRKGTQQDVMIKLKQNPFPLAASVAQASHTKATLNIKEQIIPDQVAKVIRISVIGKEDPTLPEKSKLQIILQVLQGCNRLFKNKMAGILWLQQNPVLEDLVPDPAYEKFGRHLNERQREALQVMLKRSNSCQLPIVIGPPGTGKTTVISAYAQALSVLGGSVWIVAQSNVAIRNIAERLHKDNFTDWRLLISHDFYTGWHEDLYAHLPKDNKIVTSQCNKKNSRLLLGGARVILCTLSLLSNRLLEEVGFTAIVPLRNVVVDEASQIEIGSYLPMLSKYPGINKISFFGDDKQLAPFGAEDIPVLQSVFELPHLREHAIFLDTQYRMPSGIADAISRHVYEGRLKSTSAPGRKSVLKFVDLKEGKEEKWRRSYINQLEIKAVKHLAKAAHQRNLDFRVLTPYEGQRSLIESQLEKSQSGVPYQDRVFTVDSFQGSEADIIIISLVRTDKAGFLKNLRRVNVLLSRCKRGMFICAKMDFLKGSEGSDTLLGAIAQEWKDAGESIIFPSLESLGTGAFRDIEPERPSLSHPVPVGHSNGQLHNKKHFKQQDALQKVKAVRSYQSAFNGMKETNAPLASPATQGISHQPDWNSQGTWDSDGWSTVRR